jgi:2-hydroxychromene-2-carboxylate isomerase
MRVTFVFDYVSAYAYVAWTQIHRLAEQHGAEVVPHPIVFMAMLRHHGTRPPADVPARARYILEDVGRTAKVLGLPFAPATTFPFNPILALRVSALPTPADARRRVIDGLFAAAWGDGPGLSDREVVAAAVSRAGLEPATTLADAEAPENKERLRALTDAAIGRGVFGVPSMVLEEGSRPPRLFWGYDSFPHLERALRGEDPLDPAEVVRWQSRLGSA